MHRLLIITALGAGAIVTGWASQVYALPNTPTEPGSGVTLSGTSLQGLQNRDADRDFQRFFSGGSSNVQGDNDVITKPSAARSPLGNVEVRGGTSSTESSSDAFRYQGGDSDTQVRVQYRLTE